MPMSGAPRKGATVLVVDDEPAVAELVRVVLERRGWQVVVSLERRDACDLLRANPDKFALVLSDIVMPFMSAHEFLAVARATNPKLRVVMMSGHPRGCFVDIPFTPALQFLPKPFTPQQLLKAVDSVIAGPEIGDGGEPQRLSATLP
jgi:DNA-binding NtrC family response regulator